MLLSIGNDGCCFLSIQNFTVAERWIGIMESCVTDAVATGVYLVVGGALMGNAGNYFAPTLLQEVADIAQIIKEKPFGTIAPTA